MRDILPELREVSLTIVLPEPTDDQVLRAAVLAQELGIAKPTVFADTAVRETGLTSSILADSRKSLSRRSVWSPTPSGMLTSATFHASQRGIC